VSRLSVSLDVSAVPQQLAGAGRYTAELARALARRDDVSLTVLARRGDAPRWVAWTGDSHHRGGAGSEVVAVAPRSRLTRLGWEQALLPAKLGRLLIDVHHGPHYTMPERARLPRVVTVHDCTFFDHPEWHETSKGWTFRRAIRKAASDAEAVICVSAVTAERFHALCAPKAPVHVVAHGVDHDRFRPVGDGAADLHALAVVGVHQPYVAFLGTV
jgi:glycosyltransferase involved in cell wall biosynthesis